MEIPSTQAAYAHRLEEEAKQLKTALAKVASLEKDLSDAKRMADKIKAKSEQDLKEAKRLAATER